MSDGMRNLDGYLTQNGDQYRDPRITDDKVRVDALGELDLDEEWTFHFGDSDWSEVVGTVDTVSVSPDEKHWVVKCKELEYPFLVPNDESVWLDLA